MNRSLLEISETAVEPAMLMKKEKKGRIRVLRMLKTGQARRNRKEAAKEVFKTASKNMADLMSPYTGTADSKR